MLHIHIPRTSEQRRLKEQGVLATTHNPAGNSRVLATLGYSGLGARVPYSGKADLGEGGPAGTGRSPSPIPRTPKEGKKKKKKKKREREREGKEKKFLSWHSGNEFD